MKSLEDKRLEQYNKEQIAEALGDTNRYYFYQTYKRNPRDDKELFCYYIENGGMSGFHERHQQQNQ